jgi:hypothetical protein
MKIAITGSRGITDQKFVDNTLDEYKDCCSLIIHGGCPFSPDVLAEDFAQRNKIKTEIIRPDYTNYPKRYAPIQRNEVIVSKADILIAFWDGVSGGTKSTIKFAEKKGIPIKIIQYEK